MSETTTQETAPTVTPNDVAAATQGKPGETPEQTIEALRAALAKANGEAKENRIKAGELDALKVAQMSEIDRTKAEADQARAETQAAKAEALRWRIAATHGISDDDAETFLTGNDEETLKRQAERLSALKQTAPTTPKPDLTQAGQANPHALNSDGLEQALRDKLGI